MTSIEWLYERLERMIPRTALYSIDKKEYFEEAKKMHKHEIFKSYDDGNQNRYDAIYIVGYENINEEEYYEKNFKS